MENEINLKKITKTMYSIKYVLFKFDEPDKPILKSLKGFDINALTISYDPVITIRTIPLVYIELNVPLNKTRELDNNRDKLIMRISIEKHIYSKEDNNEFKLNETSIVIENIDFFAFIISELQTSQSSTEMGVAYEDENGNVKTSSLSEPNNFTQVTLQLIHKELTNLFKVRTQLILNNCDVTTALLASAKKIGFKNIILDKSNNTEKYDQIIIPPAIFIDIIRYIDTTYNLFDTGDLTIFDINRVYILDRFSKKHSYEKNELANVDLLCISNSNTTNGPSNNVGSYMDKDKKRYVIVTNSLPTFSDMDLTNSVEMSRKFKVYDRKLGLDSIKYEEANDKWIFNPPYKEYSNTLKGHGEIQDEIVYYENTLSNDNIVKKMLAVQNSSKIMLSIVLTDIDSDILKFNRLYNIKILYSEKLNDKYGGEYMLIKADVVYTRKKENKHVVTINASFLKHEW